MSGGCYGHVYSRIEEVACEVEYRHRGSPLHVAFAAHLRLVAKAVHDVEWVDSADYGEGDDVEAITAVLGGSSGADGDRLEAMQIILERMVGEIEAIRRGIAVAREES